ncbi:MAG: PEP-CTERM sorting domain-containing protein [Deltaproteobacteria bacterium]|nr:PEP-CTERM sorting domain-containing protein [Deltaproteobacteria bacterium]
MFGLIPLQSNKWIAALGLGAGLALAPMGAGAVTITAADLPSGTNFVDLGFATVTSAPGDFTHKVIAGYDVAGVLGGWESGEIDLDDESITITYDEAQTINSLDLGLLFAALEEDDLYNEQAMVIATLSDGSSVSYTLSVIDGTTASWSGPGTVTNVSPATFGNAAVWSLSSPFGAAAVVSLELVGYGPALPETYRNNDYGLVSVTSTPVPEPGMMSLMGLGLAGLAFAGRKRS